MWDDSNCHPERTREGSGIERPGQFLRGVPLQDDSPFCHFEAKS
jgi:hypothetical protein